VQGEYFSGLNMAVHSLVEVSALAWPGMLVEVEVTAVRPH
jgi:enamine deaminase RidA (YjgF/YER057c/UK114 family)